MKLKVFAWLLLSDRLNTKNMLRRRHFVVGNDGLRSNDCILCGDQKEQTLEHLFFECPFATQCWNTLQISWDAGDDRFEWLTHAKANWVGPMFMDVFVVSAWSIWKERNGLIFKRIPFSHTSWLRRFRGDFQLLKHRAKPALGGFISNFVGALT